MNKGIPFCIFIHQMQFLAPMVPLLLFSLIGVCLVLYAVNMVTSALLNLSTIMCAFPFMPLLAPSCVIATPEIISEHQPFWSTAFCKTFPSAERCVANSNDLVLVTNQTPENFDLQNALTHRFKEASTIITSSYHFSDNLSRSIQEILLGTNRINTFVKRTDLPPQAKVAVFDLLRSVRTSARETNECIQNYMSSLTNGVEYLLASADYTAGPKSPRPSSSNGVAGPLNADSDSESAAFTSTMKAFTIFTRHLTESNQQCRESILRLETELDHMVNTFVDDAFASAKEGLEEAVSRYWAVFGAGRASYDRARENLNDIDKVGYGIERLSGFTVLLDLQLQQLRAGAMELTKQAELLSSSHLPVVDVMQLVKTGCIALRQVAHGAQAGDQDGKGVEVVSLD